MSVLKKYWKKSFVCMAKSLQRIEKRGEGMGYVLAAQTFKGCPARFLSTGRRGRTTNTWMVHGPLRVIWERILYGIYFGHTVKLKIIHRCRHNNSLFFGFTAPPMTGLFCTNEYVA